MKLNEPTPKSPGVATKFCTVPELFCIPAPLIVRPMVGALAMEYALAPGAKTRLATSVVAETVRSVPLEIPRVATSVLPFGTVRGIQLRGLFQLPSAGMDFQVALPASAKALLKRRTVAARGHVREVWRARRKDAVREVRFIFIKGSARKMRRRRCGWFRRGCCRAHLGLSSSDVSEI